VVRRADLSRVAPRGDGAGVLAEVDRPLGTRSLGLIVLVFGRRHPARRRSQRTEFEGLALHLRVDRDDGVQRLRHVAYWPGHQEIRQELAEGHALLLQKEQLAVERLHRDVILAHGAAKATFAHVVRGSRQAVLVQELQRHEAILPLANRQTDRCHLASIFCSIYSIYCSIYSIYCPQKRQHALPLPHPRWSVHF